MAENGTARRGSPAHPVPAHPVPDPAAAVERHVLAPRAGAPNNPHLPLLVYRGAVGEGDRAATFESLFAGNGWGGLWRDGIYGWHHFHTTAHEVLGIAAGRARVRFGGEEGIEVALAAGDAVLIPAGVAHRNLDSSPDFLAVGGYPPGQEPDMKGTGEAEAARAAPRIGRVPVPATDPLYGRDGPLTHLWHPESGAI
ncbi:cupin domain-containing protein [Rhodospirillum centenum]|uniref:Cupin type-2 domain-containing protein n=1 Tax=Rhodospirillum centenum (strain ATCC 51521 / SW) TaxID=414684 RepID=B6ING0_RHOCS|nr:cupin domain-containing protein [Rhodospirillum centenum]ACI99057.1 conserved hypothetical protein [Rhodospirillum centenum SW]